MYLVLFILLIIHYCMYICSESWPGVLLSGATSYTPSKASIAFTIKSNLVEDAGRAFE